MIAEGMIHCDDTVVAVLTGHLLKDSEYVIKYHQGTLAIDDTGSIRMDGKLRNRPVRLTADLRQIREYFQRLLDSENTS
jgi:threonine synthase